MLHPNAAPPVLRQIEQKQNMNGTGVSESTEKWTLPHWHDPSSLRRRFEIDVGMAELCRFSARAQIGDA